MPDRLVDRRPEVTPDRLLAELTPPPRFAAVSFESYHPDPRQPSQAEAVQRLEAFAATVGQHSSRGLFGRRKQATGPGGVYLDGGFGVGKTHLLASLWQAAAGPKSYATFVELTSLVGALGFQTAVEQLSDRTLLCIDEFELDDPGDTVLVSTLLTRLSEAGVKLAATSNTQPGDLGEGRFAAADFLREIQGLAARFEPLRIDGEDYRQRGLPEAPPPSNDAELRAAADATPGATLDPFDAVCRYLAGLHPSRYGELVEGIPAVFLSGVQTVGDQSTGLRLVALIDRLYDRSVPVRTSGQPVDQLFAAELVDSGYRKKYARALSRLIALTRDGA